MIAIRIRPMEPDEAEAIVGLWERSRFDAQPWLEERMAYSHDDNLRFFRETLAVEHKVFVADEDGTPSAFLAVKGGVVGYLYVEPSEQGRGVGSALLDHAKALSPTGLSLFTHQRNARARAFYEGRGFRAVAFGVSPAPESEPDVEYAWEPEGD